MTLSDPRGGSGDDSLSTRDVHELEEEPCAKETQGTHAWERMANSQVFNDPLHDAQIVHHLDECNEEDDSAELSGNP